MKFFICLFLLSTSFAFAECDIEPLQKEIIAKYKTSLPVTNEKGEIGHATARKFRVADYFMKVPGDKFLIANFELDIKWLKGTTQTVKTLVVASVNPKSCALEVINKENPAHRSIITRRL
jgi:hypothetical protein